MGLKLNGWDYFDEKWLALVIVYNLYTVPVINKWLSRAKEVLLNNLQKRSFVNRSSDKQDFTLKGVYPSRMVGLGDIANQSGGVGPYLNLSRKQQVNTLVKYEILKSADFVLDGLVAVSNLHNSFIANIGIDYGHINANIYGQVEDGCSKAWSCAFRY